MKIKVWKIVLILVAIFALSAIGFVHVSSSTGTNVAVLTANISVGNGPLGVAYDSAKGEIFVANAGNTYLASDNTVSVISDSNNTVVATIPMEITPWYIAYDSGKGELFVTGYSPWIYVISDSNNTIVANVSVGTINTVPQSVAYDSAKGEIFVAGGNDNAVYVISDSNNTVVATIPIPETVPNYTGTFPYGLAYDSAKGEVFVTDHDDLTVTVISDSNNSVVATIDMPSIANSLNYATYDSAKGEIFVTCAYVTVYVISDSNNSVVANVDTSPSNGGSPLSLAYDSGKGEMFGPGLGNNDVTVISDSNNTVVGVVYLPLYYHGMYATPEFAAYDSAKGEVFVTDYAFANVSVISDTPGSSSITIPTLSCNPASSSLVAGSTMTVSGSLTPAASGKTITLTYTPPSGSPIVRTATTNSQGQYQDVYQPQTVGSWIVIATFAGDSQYLAANSPIAAFNVTAQQSTSKGCVIATATFGSAMAPQVQALRDFRENIALNTFAGSSFMTVFNAWYYSWSPPVAAQIAPSEPARLVMQGVLQPVLNILQASTFTYMSLSFSPELAIFMAGFAAAALLGLVYLFPIAAVSIFAVTRVRKNWALPKMSSLKYLAVPWLASIALIAVAEVALSPILMMIATSAFILLTIVFVASALSLKLNRALKRA